MMGLRGLVLQSGPMSTSGSRFVKATSLRSSSAALRYVMWRLQLPSLPARRWCNWQVCRLRTVPSVESDPHSAVVRTINWEVAGAEWLRIQN